MKQEIITRIFWIIFGIVVATSGLYSINKYLDARVAYEATECSDHAYMIYKGYDDQPGDVKERDWLIRIDECAKIEAEYQKGF